MKRRTLWRTCLRIALLLAVLFLLLLIDWLPLVKELNRLKRLEGDYEKKNRDANAVIQVFAFPDDAEKDAMAQMENDLRHSLPREADDASWLDRVLRFLRRQALLDHVAGAMIVAPAPSGAGPGAPLGLAAVPGDRGFQQWLEASRREFDRLRTAASDPGFSWYSVLNNAGFPSRDKLASRPLAIVATAGIGALLQFITHCSWFDGRLELVSLSWRQGEGRPMVLLVCRGYYLSGGPTAWPLSPGSGDNGDNPLIDTDSDLLWQKIDPGNATTWGKKELLPAGGRERE